MNPERKNGIVAKKNIFSNPLFSIRIFFAMLALIDISKSSATFNVLIVAQYLPYIYQPVRFAIFALSIGHFLFMVKT